MTLTMVCDLLRFNPAPVVTVTARQLGSRWHRFSSDCGQRGPAHGLSRAAPPVCGGACGLPRTAGPRSSGGTSCLRPAAPGAWTGCHVVGTGRCSLSTSPRPDAGGACSTRPGLPLGKSAARPSRDQKRAQGPWWSVAGVCVLPTVDEDTVTLWQPFAPQHLRSAAAAFSSHRDPETRGPRPTVNTAGDDTCGERNVPGEHREHPANGIYNQRLRENTPPGAGGQKSRQKSRPSQVVTPTT